MCLLELTSGNQSCLSGWTTTSFFSIEMGLAGMALDATLLIPLCELFKPIDSLLIN
jgi:hypothetical protein